MLLSKFFNAFKKIRINEKEPLQGHELKHVLVSSMYAEQQSAFLNSYHTGLQSNISKNILEEWWGIDSRKEALETLEDLLNRGYAEIFPVIYEAYQDNKGNYAQILENGIKPDKLQKAIELFRNLRNNYQQLLNDKIINSNAELRRIGVIGFDCGRGAFIARLCFEKNHISLAELKDYLSKYYDKLKQNCSSWETYTKSYIIGRTMWTGYESGFLVFANDLLTHDRSPLKNSML